MVVQARGGPPLAWTTMRVHDLIYVLICKCHGVCNNHIIIDLRYKPTRLYEPQIANLLFGELCGTCGVGFKNIFLDVFEEKYIN